MLLLRSNTNEIRAQFKSAGSISYARFIDEGYLLFIVNLYFLYKVKKGALVQCNLNKTNLQNQRT